MSAVLPAAPLLRQVELRGGAVAVGALRGTAAERALLRARRDGVVSVIAGDHLATSLLQLHPIQVWGSLYDEVG